jgi:hypothetical protein
MRQTGHLFWGLWKTERGSWRTSKKGSADFGKEGEKGHGTHRSVLFGDTCRVLGNLLIFQRGKNVDDGNKETGVLRGIYAAAAGSER